MIVKKLIALLSAFAFMFATAGCGAETTEKSNSEPSGVGAEDQTPLTITPGEGFEFGDYVYSPGWKIVNEFGASSIEGLEVTNGGDQTGVRFMLIKAWKGSKVIAKFSCKTPDNLAPKATMTSTCNTQDPVKDFDKFTIEEDPEWK